MVKKIKFFGGFETKVDFEDSAFGRLESILRGGGKVGIACSGGRIPFFFCIVPSLAFPNFSTTFTSCISTTKSAKPRNLTKSSSAKFAGI